jgi:Replication-relaxation
MSIQVFDERETRKKQAKAENQPFIFKPHHLRILTAIFHHHYMTAEQVTRLLYSQGNASTVRSYLPHLEKAGYLATRYLHRTTPLGSLPKLYTLDRRGFNVLKKQGLDMPKRFRRLEEKDTASTFLPHTLAVNDVLIAAETLHKQYPAITLYGYKHELLLKQEQPITITVEKRTAEGKLLLDIDGKAMMETIRIVPDLFLDVRIHQPDREKPYRCCLLLEIDLNTEGQRKIRQKVRAFLAFIKSGACLARFGTKLPTVGFINVTGGEKRRDELKAWTEAELKLTKEPHFWTELFVFTSLPEKPALPDGDALFLSPVWYTPFRKQPTMAITVGSRS